MWPCKQQGAPNSFFLLIIIVVCAADDGNLAQYNAETQLGNLNNYFSPPSRMEFLQLNDYDDDVKNLQNNNNSIVLNLTYVQFHYSSSVVIKLLLAKLWFIP